MELVNFLLLLIDHEIVVLAEEEQHCNKCHEDDEWQVEPSWNPFGPLDVLECHIVSFY
jgi:hypothetical protein